METRTRYCETRGVNTQNGVSGFMFGLLLGGVVAGAFMLLYAPRSGQELRGRFRDEINETQQMFQTWMNDIRERSESIGRTFRTEIRGALSRSGDGQRED